MSTSIDLVFHNVRFRIESQITEFVKFLSMYYSGNIIERDDSGYDILVSFELLNKKDYDDIDLRYTHAEKFSQLSRSAYSLMHSVLITDIQYLAGFKMTFTLEEKILKVGGYYCEERKLTGGLINYFYQKSRNIKLFLYLKYYLILYPLIWYNESYKNRYLLHASGLIYKGKTILFPGLGGVGKSTFVISLLSDPEFKFISDNLLLFGDNHIIPVNEAIALDKKSIALCEHAHDKIKPLNMAISHGRQYFHIDQPPVAAGIAQYIFFVKFNYKTEVTKLSAEKAKNNLELINNVAKEVQEYRSIASVLNLVLGFVNIAARMNSASEMIDKAECYELNIRPNENLDKIRDFFLEHLG